jgi:hypothetical protein
MIKFYLHVPELNNWQMVFAEMAECMYTSGLIEGADKIVLCMNGRKENMDPIVSILQQNSDKIEVCYVNANAGKWEWPSINKLKEDIDASETEDDYIGYAHLKGLSRPDPTDKMASDWRHMLSYFIIEKWKDNIDLLSQGYETSSINWTDAPWPHYSGNFWWARSNYIRRLSKIQDPSTIAFGSVSRYLPQLPPVVLDSGNYRYEHEAWIGSNKPRHAELFASPGRTDQSYHYRFEYPPTNYRKD